MLLGCVGFLPIWSLGSVSEKRAELHKLEGGHLDQTSSLHLKMLFSEWDSLSKLKIHDSLSKFTQ